MKKFNLLDTILSPNVTEKATALSEHNKIVFKVRNSANKNQSCARLCENHAK